jgi:hypothetical protein
MYPVWLTKILIFFGMKEKIEYNPDKYISGDIVVDSGTGMTAIEKTDFRKKLFELF